MKCISCGAELPEGTIFCTSCGTKVEAPAPAQTYVETPPAPQPQPVPQPAQQAAPVQTYQAPVQSYQAPPVQPVQPVVQPVYMPPQNDKPISPLGYIGYNILFSLPLIGIIMIFVFSFSNSNINRRNYARSYLIVFLVVLGLTIIGFVLSLILGASAAEFFTQYAQSLQ